MHFVICPQDQKLEKLNTTIRGSKTDTYQCLSTQVSYIFAFVYVYTTMARHFVAVTCLAF